MPLLEGLDGVNKMSKSLNNYVAIQDPPQEIFGKLMSISDTLMWRYIELLSFASIAQIQQWRESIAAGANPRDIKVEFAREIVDRFHGAGAGERALADFEARFRQHSAPDVVEEVILTAPEAGIPIANALKQAGLTETTSEAIRMLGQGGVKIDGEKVSDKSLLLPPGTSAVFQIGKRKFARITIS
jgi:tyrosyl-tRNA synthetase